MRKNAKEVLDTMRAGHIDADARLKDLGIANKHLVAVARAMSIDAQIVIMDEPTAALSMKEIEDLFLLIEFLKNEGKAMLFISHKFDEIYRIADRYTVFRDGEMVGEGLIKDAGQSQIVRMMVGRSVDHIFPQARGRHRRAGARRSRACATRPNSTTSASSCTGEILGFYGLVGAGRSEVMQAIFGITRAISAARSRSTARPSRRIGGGCDRGRHRLCARGARQAGRGHRPADLPERLAALARSARRNQACCGWRKNSLWPAPIPSGWTCAPSSLSQDVGTLSGGNQQKVVIANWLATAPKVIILDEPTKGIDIGSKAAVHGFMAELVAQGLSVIMVSSELPEILGMSDRVVVMREGRIAAVYDNKELTPRRWCSDGSGDRGMKTFLKYREIWLARGNLVLIGLISMRSPAFADPANLRQVFNDTSILMILALGQMAVILTRSIDLSMASNLCFTGMVVAMLNAAHPAIPIPLLIGIALLVGLGLGAINGFWSGG